MGSLPEGEDASSEDVTRLREGCAATRESARHRPGLHAGAGTPIAMQIRGHTVHLQSRGVEGRFRHEKGNTNMHDGPISRRAPARAPIHTPVGYAASLAVASLVVLLGACAGDGGASEAEDGDTSEGGMAQLDAQTRRCLSGAPDATLSLL